MTVINLNFILQWIENGKNDDENEYYVPAEYKQFIPSKTLRFISKEGMLQDIAVNQFYGGIVD